MYRKLPRRMRGFAQFLPAFLIGFVGAIMVPAYQDYTIRAQVTQGLNLASAVKVAVAEHFATTGKWPRDLRELKFDSVPRGQYVTFAALNHGTVVIRYSSTAGVPIQRQQVTLRPTITSDGKVSWSCGYSPDMGADPATGAAAPHATTIPPKYLPSACRGLSR